MNTVTDYLILGAGPAGLQLGYFLQKHGRDYLILERSDCAGSFFKKYPRHRFLISINKVHTGKDNPEVNLRWDWNSLLCDAPELSFKNYSQRYFPHPDDLVRYLGDFSQHYALRVQHNTEIGQVHKDGDLFVARDQHGHTYTAKRLVVATGLTLPYMPEIPGIELCDQYSTHSIDPQDYANQRVLVIGKGNSAFETANHLVETAAVIHLCSPHSVKFAWQTHFVGNLRAVNNDFLDTYQLKSQNTVIDAEIKWIKRQDDGYAVFIAYSHAKGQTRLLHYDRVIACTGFRFDASIFDESCQPEMVYWDKFPAQTSEWESVNVPGLYFAGTLMQACDFKKTMSGFIHGFRHNIQALANIFELKYHQQAWPGEVLPAEAEPVLQKILLRLNNGAGLFLQPGFLCDVLVVSEQGDQVTYHADVRSDYVPNSPFARSSHYYTVTAAYGHFDGDPFSVDRDPTPDKADEASYLHPIVRRYDQGRLISEHHVQDDLENEWYLDEYVIPLRQYLKKQFSNPEVSHQEAG